jgi:hypothetical protein
LPLFGVFDSETATATTTTNTRPSRGANFDHRPLSWVGFSVTGFAVTDVIGTPPVVCLSELQVQDMGS